MNTTDEILEIVRYIKDNAVMRSEFTTLNDKFDGLSHEFTTLSDKFDGLNHEFQELDDKFDVMNNKFDGLKSDLYTKIDGFINLHQKLDLESAVLKGLYFKHEKNFEKITNELGIEFE